MRSKATLMNIKISFLVAALLVPGLALAIVCEPTCMCTNTCNVVPPVVPPVAAAPSKPSPSASSTDESKKVINSSSDLQIAPKPPTQTKSGGLIEFVTPLFVDKSKSCS